MCANQMSFYNNKVVLITGGAGFVGSNLARTLVTLGANVFILDNLFTGRIENIEDLTIDYPKSVYFFKKDIEDFETVKNLVRQSDIIFHLAARNIIVSSSEPRKDFDTNVGGTLNILLAMQEAEVERMVYTSSASVYGNPKYLPINEDDQINLLTPYAVGKYAGEGYCMAFHESHHLPVTVLRLSNVYGPYQRPDNPYCGVVSKFMDNSKQYKPIEIHGDGLSTRDFTYVSDVVDALLIAGVSPKAEGEVFNVATGIETPIINLAESIRGLYSYVDTNLHIGNHFHGSDIEYVDRRDIDNIRRRVLNIEKIRRKLGWTPLVRLQDGLDKTKLWLEKGD